MKGGVVRINAAAIADATGFFAAPGSLLVELSSDGTTLPLLLASGSPSETSSHEASLNARSFELPDAVILPGFVNAHTHLDLSHVGPRPHTPGDGFVAWVNMIRKARLHEPEHIAASVRLGAQLNLAAGTVAVGDIAGAPGGKSSLHAWRAARDLLLGVSFIEFFSRGIYREAGLNAGLGALREGLLEQAQLYPDSTPGLRLGLQPHAPNTVELEFYRRATQAAAALAAPLATHLAETPEEQRFIADGSGPQREMLESMGIWDEQAQADIGRGMHPVEHLSEALAASPYLVAHVNDAPDRGLEILASTRACVAYCPRASAYFDAQSHFGPHRYRDMIAAGIPVALGTDSIVNLPPHPGIDTLSQISILDEMQFLFARDGVDPLLLLRMATLNGAAALQLDPDLFRFATSQGASHPIAGASFVRLNSEQRPLTLHSVMRSSHPSQLLLNRNLFSLAE